MSQQLSMAFSASPRERRSRTPYYHTTPLTVEQMAGAIRLAEQQDELVLAIFRAHHGAALSPSQVWEIGKGYGKAWLLTSVRRSITNLADPKCGVLVRLNVTRQGPYGRPEHCWALQAQARAA